MAVAVSLLHSHLIELFEFVDSDMEFGFESHHFEIEQEVMTHCPIAVTHPHLIVVAVIVVVVVGIDLTLCLAMTVHL
ncbi:hypothetical protein WICMUC_001919 [Wickerhamomyces mucosus]|uniref:Uncharacterized protein n=1 Tax=Wickerhamomyces mucosus TaxID=1378264 RepID=A0A9P8TEV6_9ASCO|nr:hypothetical protein WICMUC_001919 [Wickerhamomyces mucosus]